MKYGISASFRSLDERRKLLYVATCSTVFTFYIAEFGQVAIGQITDIVVYYPLIGILLRQRMIDKEEQRQLEPEEA